MGKSAPKAPAAPDPTVTANAQAAANAQTAQLQAQLNRVNQQTPQGSLTYTQPDPNNPNTWTATQQYSPTEQNLYNLSTQAQGLYGNTALSQLGAAAGSLSTPLQTPASPFAAYNQAMNTVNQPLDTNYSDVRNQYVQSQFGLMQPTWDQQRQTLQSQLANQGVVQGSDAYNNATRGLENQISNAQAQILGGATTQTGQAIQQGLELRQEPITEAQTASGLLGTGLQQAATLQQLPLNEASALLSGSQVAQPQFANVPQTQVGGTNVLGAYQLQQQAQDVAYQAQMQQYQGALGGVGSILGQGLGAWGYGGFNMPSDERLKTDIREVGELKQPGGATVPLKTFRFKGDPVRRMGVIAQDVEAVHPQAVHTHPATGLKGVDYARVLLAAHHAAMEGRRR